MKLVIIIPSYNEEKTIGQVIADIPKDFPYITQTEIMVINDGSTDDTIRMAINAGCDYVIDHQTNKGLAKAISTGLQVALSVGADIIVILDADNQYNSNEIANVIEPICKGSADLVIGDRQVMKLDHMPFSKKIGNTIASKVTSWVCGVKIEDAQTGFRALSREAALSINILSEYTYTQEMIIQSAFKRLKIIEIPVEFRKRDGRSRLINSIFGYAAKAGITMIRTALHYKPLKVFLSISAAFFCLAAIFGLRILWQIADTGSIAPFYPSALAAGVFLIVGFQTAVLAFHAENSRSNMIMLEKLLYMQKQNNNVMLDHRITYVKNRGAEAVSAQQKTMKEV